MLLLVTEVYVMAVRWLRMCNLRNEFYKEQLITSVVNTAKHYDMILIFRMKEGNWVEREVSKIRIRVMK
jgi:hypothetical protein